jgi:hypothetical protein
MISRVDPRLKEPTSFHLEVNSLFKIIAKCERVSRACINEKTHKQNGPQKGLLLFECNIS